MFNSTEESQFLPNDKPTKRQKQVASILVDMLKKHRKNPQIQNIGSLSRSEISDTKLSTDDLINAGFKASLIAVPEKGQSALTTYRHPRNGLHLHKHPETWMYHEDGHPALSMVLERYKQDNPNYTFKDLAKFALTKAIPESSKHIINEGLPGWAAWIAGGLKGSSGLRNPDQVNYIQAIKNKALAAGALAGGRLLLDKDVDFSNEFMKNIGMTTGFTFGHELAKRTLSKLSEKYEYTRHPSYFATSLLVGTPLLTAYLGRKVTSRLLKELEE